MGENRAPPGDSEAPARQSRLPVAAGEQHRDGKPRRIGVALGSGSARGLAHIGVLRALVESGFEVEYVAGSSMGAFVGAIFAAGKLESLEQEFRGFDWGSIASLLDPVFPRSGLLQGQKIGDFMRTHLPVDLIEELPIAFRAMATDLATGAEVEIAAGDVIEAVRASIAVPGIFTPVRNNGRLLVDGGLVNPVPVNVVRAMGARFVVAVDLNHDIVVARNVQVSASPRGASIAEAVTQMLAGFDPAANRALVQLREWLRREPLPGIFDVLLASIYIMQARVTQATLRQDRPEILIQPPLGAVRFMEFGRAAEIVEIGYRSAMEALGRFEAAATT